METRELLIRPVRNEDYSHILEVEKQATPNLLYLHKVFEEFVNDPSGAFLAAEIDGELCGCGKMSVLPEGTGWVETLRVNPEFQGMGIGKGFYKRFVEIADRDRIPVLRMYTGRNNKVSKGLAERYGFTFQAEFAGLTKELDSKEVIDFNPNEFYILSDEKKVIDLIMPLKDVWNGFIVFNRTFYQINPALCSYLTKQGFVYTDTLTQSLFVSGSRFNNDPELHIGLINGDLSRCLKSIEQLARAKKSKSISCLLTPGLTDKISALKENKYRLYTSDFIVMQKKNSFINLPK